MPVLFEGNKLAPAWEYTTGGVIWKIVSSEDHFVGEERDLGTKEVTFFCVEKINGRVLWEKTQFGEKWWTGIEAVERGRVYLHGFASPDMPEHRGLTAVDVLTGRKLWYNAGIKLLSLTGPTIRVAGQHSGRETEFELDGRTGSSPGQQRSLENTGPGSGGVTDHHPVPLAVLQAHSPEAAKIVRRIIPDTCTDEAVEALEDSGVVVVHYQGNEDAIPAAASQSNDILKIIERGSGRVVYVDVIRTGAVGAAFGAFFVQEGMLYYIRERRTLTAIRLSNPS